MRKLLNTLYVTTDGAHLYKEGETILADIDGRKSNIPIHAIGAIYCFGFKIYVSPALMAFCGEKNVELAFFKPYGRFMARVQGPVSGNVLLRREQYRKADDSTCSTEIARNIIAAKISSARTVLQRTLRNKPEHPEGSALNSVIDNLKWSLNSLKKAGTTGEIRGIEGDAANRYFGVFDHMIFHNKSQFFMQGRNRRPPLDNVNALLSFLYAIVLQDCVSACEGVGLDPCVGFLHTDRPGRPSLALDLLEEFRAFLADRMVLTLINRKQVLPKDFVRRESGAIELADDARKTVLTAYQERKRERIKHPFLDETIEIGLVFLSQAMLMARYLRGDMDFYPPFVWRT